MQPQKSMGQDNDGIVFFELKDEKGSVVARQGKLEALPEKFSLNSQENFSEQGLRNAFRKNDNGSIHLILTDSHELFQGRKSIQRACDIYLSLIPKFKQVALSQR